MNELTPLDAIVLIALAIGITKIFTGPLAVALGDRIRGRREPATDPGLAREVDQVQSRLAEVEERLDFAERLLASKEHADHLPGGAHR
jgi:hypothetical protein